VRRVLGLTSSGRSSDQRPAVGEHGRLVHRRLHVGIGNKAAAGIETEFERLRRAGGYGEILDQSHRDGTLDALIVAGVKSRRAARFVLLPTGRSDAPSDPESVSSRLLATGKRNSLMAASPSGLADAVKRAASRCRKKGRSTAERPW